MSTREVLAANMRKLMECHPELGTLKKITAASNGRLSNGKLGRIRQATHATDINTVGELAEVFGLEPWQLLVPNLNPEALPQIAGSELLDSIKALVVGQAHSISTNQQAQQSVTKGGLGRLPGEVLRTGQVKGKSGEVNRPGKTSQKRHRGGT